MSGHEGETLAWRRRVVLVALASLALTTAGPTSAEPDAPAPGSEAPVHADEDEEEDGLRDRLIEREDRRRVPDPITYELAGRPLTVEGEVAVGAIGVRRRSFLPEDRRRDRLALETATEVELFYSFGPELSLFAQFAFESERDQLSGTPDRVSEGALTRGEMWVYSEDIAGTGLFVELGRLDYEDERRWWWDEDLDALRIGWEADDVDFDIELSVARELFQTRADEDFIDPEQDRVLRIFGEASYDWAEEHGLELAFLRMDDRSRTERPGEVVRLEREDESDARLTWWGARLLGAFELPGGGALGYWADFGQVRGTETVLELDELSERLARVEEVQRRQVRGWAFDLGVNWLLDAPLEPRFFLGYARGSGDDEPDDGVDRRYRQTGLHANEGGLGGVERYGSYGVLLEPELSNLSVWTAGFGLSVLRASSFDLAFHHYRLVTPAFELPEARLEAELTGRHTGWGGASTPCWPWRSGSTSRWTWPSRGCGSARPSAATADAGAWASSRRCASSSDRWREECAWWGGRERAVTPAPAVWPPARWNDRPHGDPRRHSIAWVVADRSPAGRIVGVVGRGRGLGVLELHGRLQGVPPAHLADQAALLDHREAAHPPLDELVGQGEEVHERGDRERVAAHQVANPGDHVVGVHLVVRRGHRLEAVELGEEPQEVSLVVDHRCARDAVLEEHFGGLQGGHFRAERDQLAGHDLADRGDLGVFHGSLLDVPPGTAHPTPKAPQDLEFP